MNTCQRLEVGWRCFRNEITRTTLCCCLQPHGRTWTNASAPHLTIFTTLWKKSPHDSQNAPALQVGNANFAFSLQQLVGLPLLWSLPQHLGVTNATTPWPPAAPVRVFTNLTSTLVSPLVLSG